MSKLTRRPSQRIGYVRISTLDRDPEHQIKALEEGGCDAIYADRVSGAPGIARSWEKPLIISRRTTRWGTLGVCAAENRAGLNDTIGGRES